MADNAVLLNAGESWEKITAKQRPLRSERRGRRCLALRTATDDRDREQQTQGAREAAKLGNGTEMAMTIT